MLIILLGIGVVFLSCVQCQMYEHNSAGLDPKIKTALPDLSLWVLHSGSKPSHLFPSHHLHLLGHPCPVHTKCKQLKHILTICENQWAQVESYSTMYGLYVFGVYLEIDLKHFPGVIK